jgi:serine/threonine protein phosphatase 1
MNAGRRDGKKMIRTLALGDIHGGYKALMQCLERSGFDCKKDRLIVIGDVCDGWPDAKRAIDKLLEANDLILLMSNHDEWALNWMINDDRYSLWVAQGGSATIASYGNIYNEGEVPLSHINFLKNAVPYYIDAENRLFVHGGIVPGEPIDKQSLERLMWDRNLIYEAMKLKKNSLERQLTAYKEVFIGHTSTMVLSGSLEPLHACEVWNLDTGGGMGGKLTIMDVETKEYWQSDFVRELYK